MDPKDSTSTDDAGAATLADRIEVYEKRAVEAFYVDSYLACVLAARPCEAADELPPPGTPFD